MNEFIKEGLGKLKAEVSDHSEETDKLIKIENRLKLFGQSVLKNVVKYSSFEKQTEKMIEISIDDLNTELIGKKEEVLEEIQLVLDSIKQKRDNMEVAFCNDLELQLNTMISGNSFQGNFKVKTKNHTVEFDDYL